MPISDHAKYLFLLLLLACFASFYQIPSGDHWTHIAQGLYILDNGVVPQVDVSSFTYAGTPWMNWEWLHNVAQASFWRLSEDFGVIFLRFLQIAALLVLFFLYLLRRTERPFLSFLSSVALLLLTLPRLNDRPHVFAYVCLVAIMLIMAVPKRMQKEHFLVLLAVLVVWRNAHPSWPLGLALMGAFFLDAYREEGSSLLPLPPRKIIFAMLGLSFLVLLLTPLPLDFRHYIELQSQGAALPEWKPLFSLDDVFSRIYFLGFIVFVPIALMAVWVKRDGRLGYVLLFLAVLGNAFLHNRFIPDAVLLGLPLIIESISPITFRFPVRPILLAILITVGTLFLSRTYLASYYDIQAGWGVDETHNPLYAGRFLKEQGAGGNIFAAYWNTSDFLLCYLHPRVKVTLDIRVPGLYPFDFANRYWYISNETDFRKHVLTLPLDYIILGRPDPVAFQKHDQGMEQILTHDGYDLIYFDRRYAVYRTPQGRSRPETAAMPTYRVLRRWQTDPLSLEKASQEKFDDIRHDLQLLKKHTAGRDNTYRELLVSLYSLPFFSEQQKEELEALY